MSDATERRDDGLPLDVHIQTARYAMFRLLRADAPHERLREQWSKLETLLDTPVSRDGAEEAGENLYMPTYGKLPWDQLGRDVMEAITSQRIPFKFTAEGYPGHEMAGINFNSLARIVDKYRLATPLKPAPGALREALHAMTLYARAVVKVVMDRSPDGKVPKHLDALLSDATEKSKAALSPAPVPPADGVREQLRAAQHCVARETTRVIRLEQVIRDSIESLERNSTSAPVVECLKAALASPDQQSNEGTIP